MKATRIALSIAPLLALAACNLGGLSQPGPTPLPDLRATDLEFVDPPDLTALGQDGPPNPCGDTDPTCEGYLVGAPFKLQSDQSPDPAESDRYLKRDADGALVIDAPAVPTFDKLWIANMGDLSNDGSISKIDQKTIREVARYRTFTCLSSKAGTVDECDGTKGCCSLDDWYRYQARKAKANQPPHERVQRTNNYPSRTGVDWNGDLFLSNRAFGGQSSVTKIAGDKSRCIDRNHNGRVDTSSDSNADGFIQTDCNGDGQPDNLLGVKATPCTNGLPQEFYGEDDECILWTTNTFPNNAIGRPLALAADGVKATSVWAGSFNNGNYVHIDGATGLTLEDAQLPQECYGGTGPYGAVIDSRGILWSTPLGGGKLCYLDTTNTKVVGAVRDPQWGQAQGYGIALDRDQNVWLGLGVHRYTPDRSNGVRNLGSGWWTHIAGVSGVGIASDSRTSRDYYVWSCQSSHILGIPSSAVPVMKSDSEVPLDGSWPTIQAPCYGVGVDSVQNVWAVPQGGYTTRALVDKTGKVTAPVVGGKPLGNNLCPAGDSCQNVSAYTYSDFTGFSLRNFGSPGGSYGVVLRSHCLDTPGATGTYWRSVQWQADLPGATSIAVRYRMGSSASPDPSWTTLSPPFTASPIDLGRDVPADYLEVQVGLSSPDHAVTPRLLGMTVYAECIRG